MRRLCPTENAFWTQQQPATKHHKIHEHEQEHLLLSKKEEARMVA